MSDATIHLDEAIRLLTGHAEHEQPDGSFKEMDGVCTLVWDLERIDRAIGPAGGTIFASIAEKIGNAFVEIKAARAALPPSSDHRREE